MPHMFEDGDAYPLRNDTMKPYLFRQMDNTHRMLNFCLSRARRVVENVFGLLAKQAQCYHHMLEASKRGEDYHGLSVHPYLPL